MSKILKAAQKLMKKYAIPLDKEEELAILPHIRVNLEELKKDIDYLVQFGGVSRKDILNLVIKLLSHEDKKISEDIKTNTPKDSIIDALEKMKLKSPNEALFSVKDLRARLNLSKQEFDKAALELSRENKISLHFHDYPQSLPQTERDQLIHDVKNDIYYIGVNLRS